MKKEAIGMIEAIGLATAIEAADAAVKSANVRLIGYEYCRGDGMTTVKIAGDVGAVKAGLQAARTACARGRGVFSSIVIPRPGEGLEKMIYNDQTIGYTPPPEAENNEAENNEAENNEAENNEAENSEAEDSQAENNAEQSHRGGNSEAENDSAENSEHK